jgi:RNA polymerase sigma factor (sigma-70 family)
MEPGPGNVDRGMLGERTTLEGFEQLYHQELALQVRRASLLTGDVEAAHDLVHDAFEVYRRWDRLREPGPYLARAVVNRCRDHARRHATQRRKLPLLVERGTAEDDPLWDALATLPFHHRAALVLRFYHRMTEAEIAAVLGCRPGSVGPWIQRGLRRLRKDLS